MTTAVSERSEASSHMLSLAQKGRDLMGGAATMRAAGERYLPKFEAEGREDYDTRLTASWLFNAYRKTTRDITGKVFAKPVELGEGADTRLIEWAENADLQGNDLSTFARRVFEDAVSGCGVSYIMVDAPPRSQPVTQAQAESANLRPYMVHLRVEDILGWKAQAIDNVQTLTQIRIKETVEEADPEDEFASVTIDQIRVLDLTDVGVQTRLYRQGENGSSWVMIDEPTFSGLSQITVVPFYANRSGFFMGEPLLDDLADVNVAHWQSQSDQRNILHVARVPILFGAGFAEDEGIVVGSKQAVISSESDAKLSWVEHSGKAIDAGRTDLKDLEFQMEAFGLQLLAARPSAQSATGEALDAAKETSTLAMTADELKDTIEQAMLWMAEYGGLQADSIEVKVNKEFGVTMMEPQEVMALLTSVNTGNMSRETFLRELMRRGVIAPDMSVDDEIERIENEAPDFTDVAPGEE